MAARMSPALLRTFPGWEIVEPGLRDAAAGRDTAHSQLVWIAWPRLVRSGLVDESIAGRRDPDPESTLYQLLRAKGGDAYSEYNALLRRLCRFERALDRYYASSPRGSS